MPEAAYARNGGIEGVPASRAPAADPLAVVVRRDSLFRRLLACADMAAVALSLLLAVAAFGDGSLKLAALVALPLFVLVAKSMGLYDRDQHLLHKTTLDEAPELFGIATVTALVVGLSGGALVAGGLDRGQILGIWLLLFVLLIALRSATRFAGRRAAPVERCLFIGDAASAEVLGHKLATSGSVKAELVGWIPADEHGNSSSVSERVRALIEQHDVHRIILGPGPGRSGELLDSVRRLKDHGPKISVLPDVARVVSSSVELDRLNGITLMGIPRFEITMSSRFIKRAFDLLGSALALALLSPLMLVIALAIKLTSAGPVLYRQQRAGRHGESFAMLKFRSMVDGADEMKEGLRHLNEADGVFKIASDPRVTRVGHLLRRTHVDELPQLLNVLRGQMSLVGPRPLPLDEDAQILGWHRRRLDLKPGITGTWQALGSSRVPVREMVQLDYQYVANWSLWNDIRILLLTVPHILRRRGL